MTVRSPFDETESEFYLRVQNFRAAQWTYLSPADRQLVLEYLAGYCRVEYQAPALKDRLRALLDKAGF